MQIFYPFEHYKKNCRGQLFPLLKPFVKNENFTDEQRIKLYGVSAKDYEFTNSLSTAEIVILPMSWNHYVQNKKLHLAKELIERAAGYHKTVWSWNSGDFGVKVPRYNNLKIFRMGGYMSRQQTGHCGMPVFIKDRLTEYQEEKHFKFPYAQKPVVGFCGQARSSVLNAISEKLRIVLRNLQSNLNLSANEPQALIASTRLRAQLLNRLIKNELIEDQFIFRKKYRAGVSTAIEKEKTTNEFYENISSSLYVLCVRGAGNFSVRFYETLMMGRIPVYVHTDGFLPLYEEIDWKKHVVWIDYKDRNRIAEVIVDFHSKLNENSLKNLLESNRMLWEKKLTLDFFKYII